MISGNPDFSVAQRLLWPQARCDGKPVAALNKKNLGDGTSSKPLKKKKTD
jgi:hypothetical protein